MPVYLAREPDDIFPQGPGLAERQAYWAAARLAYAIRHGVTEEEYLARAAADAEREKAAAERRANALFHYSANSRVRAQPNWVTTPDPDGPGGPETARTDAVAFTAGERLSAGVTPSVVADARDLMGSDAFEAARAPWAAALDAKAGV